MLRPLSASKWNETTAAHLLNRAGFGGTPAQIEAIQRNGVAGAVRELVDFPAERANVPQPDWAQPHNIRQIRMEARSARNNPEEGRTKMRELQQMEGEVVLGRRFPNLSFV
jgi:hypothetical protein